MTPTTEQEIIIQTAITTKNNIMINSLAGCGKTSTLEMIEKAIKEKPVLYLCFNKRIATEASKRMLNTTSVRTFNGIGHRIWAQTQGSKNLSLDAKKTQTIFRGIMDEVPQKSREPLWAVYWNVIQGVATAKAMGYVPEGKFPNARRLCTQSQFHAALDESPDDLTADLIDLALTRSITAAYAGSIDFNDQVYMPALFGGIYPQFPLVAIDEYQDLNPVNHAMIDRLVKHRLIGVGDPWQNIYGFRGAAAEGMRIAVGKFSMSELDLSVSFRCPRSIVENARWRVPHYKWMKEGGHVEILKDLSPGNVPDDAVFLCRNNAPLFRLAFNLMASGHSVSVAGSDIGPKLIGTMRKLGPEDISQAGVKGLIDDWEAERVDKGSTTAPDLANCMRVFAGHGANLGQAIRYAEHLFAQSGTIRLLTVHKAKGLEFATVYFLDSYLCKADEQDLNLRYVAETRAQERLFYIDSRNIQW